MTSPEKSNPAQHSYSRRILTFASYAFRRVGRAGRGLRGIATRVASIIRIIAHYFYPPTPPLSLSTNAEYQAVVQSNQELREKLSSATDLALARLHQLAQMEGERNSLRVQLSDARSELTSARQSALTATTQADEFRQLYLSEVQDHKSTLKGEANWFALSTSTRRRLHPDIASDEPPVPPPGSGLASETTPIRASLAARMLSRKTLEDVAREEKRMAEQIESDLTSETSSPLLPSEDPLSPAHQDYARAVADLEEVYQALFPNGRPKPKEEVTTQ